MAFANPEGVAAPSESLLLIPNRYSLICTQAVAQGYPGLRYAAPWADLGPSRLGLICTQAVAQGYPGLRCAAPWADLGPSRLGLIALKRLPKATQGCAALHPGLI